MGPLITLVEQKRCLMCNKRIARTRYPGGHLTSPSQYAKKAFCSLSCANSRSKGGLSRNAFCARARKLLRPWCECCGTTKRLHAHHVNEDWRNNDPENVQTLCTFCHQFWHATHRRLGIKPSTRMPQIATFLPAQRMSEVFLETEQLAQWMITNSYATGRGDTMADMLAELKWQIEDRITAARTDGYADGLGDALQ